MKKAIIALGVLALLSCKGKGGEKPKEPEGKVISQIGDIKITEEDLGAQVPDVEGFTMGEGDRKLLVEGLEKLSVFYLAAKEQGLDKDPKVSRRVQWAERAVLADEFIKRQMETIQVTDADIANYIKANEADFKREVNLLEVAITEPSMADTVKKLLRDGSYAAAKMLEYFAQQGSLMVNPIGYVNVAALRFNMPQDAADAVKKAKVQDILGPYEAQGMHVLIMVLDSRAASPDMKQIEPVLKQALLAEKQQQAVDSLYNFYRAKYTTTAGGEKK